MTTESHIVPMFLSRVENHGQKEVFRFKDSQGNYQSINWEELKEKVDNVISSMHAMGVKKGDMLGIFSQNKPQWIITDLAAMAIGAVVVPFYATALLDQLTYIVKETEMKLMFVGADAQMDIAKQLLKDDSPLEKVISFEKVDNSNTDIYGFDEFLKISFDKGVRMTADERMEEYSADDLATIIYTSGTTGEPKGVMLKQDNFVHCFDIHDLRLDVRNSDVSLCFLPLSHVFERMWSHYLLYKGAVNVFLEDPKEIISVLPIVKPTVMCTVPRFFDKTFDGIHDEAAKWPGFKQKIFKWSVSQGMKSIIYKSQNKKLPFGLNFKLSIANALVFKKLRAVFGGNIRFMPCAGAAISHDILKFFHAVGLFVNYGYGATETTATVSCFKEDEYFLDTCGSIMPGIEVKIGDNSEILVKGRTVFYGYYKKENDTAEVLKDGWFYSGDEGYIDENNNLIMVDRIKDLMKTSVGKYVSPQKLEMLLSQDELVEQIIVVGDNRQYVSALVVPAMDKLKTIAKELNVSCQNDQELVDSEKINELFKTRFEMLQKDITPYERVVVFTLLPKPFSIEAGTMTSTLKLRRSSIEKVYSNYVEKMYD